MIYAPKILIIDDSTVTCFYMANALQKAGYTVGVALDGREGLTRVLQEVPDCLILDVILPGMGGYEICRQIRSRQALRQLPILMVSTKNTPLDQAWGLRQGANFYLPKPFTQEVLVNTVNELLPYYAAPAAISTDTPVLLESVTPALLPLHKLVPHRNEATDVMWASNPGSVLIKDKRTRQVYAAIDGRRNIEAL